MSTRTGDGAVTSFEKPENISWEAATVELPPMPVIPPGADAMSMTISAVLPTLEAMMTANVTSLAAKENTFSGKVGAAQAAYNVGDESAGQSVGQSGDMLGQLTGQLGQLAQMPQQAASSLGGGQGGGGQGGGFGQLIQQAMQAAQGAVQQGTQAAQQGQGPGGGPGGPPPGMPGAPTPEQRENEQNARDEQQDQREAQQDERQAAQDARDEQQDRRQAVLDSREHGAAGGSTAGPAPVAPHGPSRPTAGGEDLAKQV